MNISMFQAYIDGYGDYLFDMKCLSVYQGYWAGYFQSKKPKPVSYVLNKLEQEHRKSKKANGPKLPKPEVDVDRFMALEEKRMMYMANKRKGK